MFIRNFYQNWVTLSFFEKCMCSIGVITVALALFDDNFVKNIILLRINYKKMRTYSKLIHSETFMLNGRNI